MNMILFWTAMAVLFGLIEALTAGLVSLWFIAGSVVAAIAAALHWHWSVQAILFLAVSIAVLVFLRPMLAGRLTKIHPTNADALIGQTAVVTLAIDNVQGVGQVKVAGAIWSAVSADGSVLETDTPVTILEIRGVKLVVAKKEEN
jgi:membrane protein implicated in regulation of membrane protease activity